AGAIGADVEHAVGEAVELVGGNAIGAHLRLRGQARDCRPSRGGCGPVGGSVSGGRSLGSPDDAGTVGRHGDGIVIAAGDAGWLAAADGPALSSICRIGEAVLAVA